MCVTFLVFPKDGSHEISPVLVNQRATEQVGNRQGTKYHFQNLYRMQCERENVITALKLCYGNVKKLTKLASAENHLVTSCPCSNSGHYKQWFYMPLKINKFQKTVKDKALDAEFTLTIILLYRTDEKLISYQQTFLITVDSADGAVTTSSLSPQTRLRLHLFLVHFCSRPNVYSALNFCICIISLTSVPCRHNHSGQ